MNDETALVLELVFHRGLLSREELEPLRRELSGHPDPLDELVRTIRIDPKEALPLYNRGMARRGLGDFAEARRDFEKALEVAPADWPLRAPLLEDLDSLPQ